MQKYTKVQAITFDFKVNLFQQYDLFLIGSIILCMSYLELNKELVKQEDNFCDPESGG